MDWSIPGCRGKNGIDARFNQTYDSITRFIPIDQNPVHMSDTDTKTTILDAAESLFARRGFDATSLREITRAAGVNTASVHYHFQSRTGLIEAVVARRAAPVNAERLRQLEAIEAQYAQSLPLEPVLRALIEPVVLARNARGVPRGVLGRLMGRVVFEAGDELHDIIVRTFEPVAVRFLPALARALPGLARDELEWRLHLVVGSVLFALTVPVERTGPCTMIHTIKPAHLADRLVAFAASALTGARPAGQREGPS